MPRGFRVSSPIFPIFLLRFFADEARYLLKVFTLTRKKINFPILKFRSSRRVRIQFKFFSCIVTTQTLRTFKIGFSPPSPSSPPPQNPLAHFISKIFTRSVIALLHLVSQIFWYLVFRYVLIPFQRASIMHKVTWTTYIYTREIWPGLYGDGGWISAYLPPYPHHGHRSPSAQSPGSPPPGRKICFPKSVL